MLKKLSDLKKYLEKQDSKKKLVLAAAQDEHALLAAMKAKDDNIVDLILVGNEKKIKIIAEAHNLNLENVEIINEEDQTKAAIASVKLVSEKKADILMKGHLATSTLLKAVLNKEFGLRKGKVLSHLALFEIENYHKLIGLTDAAMNIAPELNDKVAIIENSVGYMRKLGIEKPKVACLAAVEVVNANMQATVDAALLSKMAQRGQIKNCIIDGPLAFDNAINKESAEHKGIESEVSGDADILLAPNIETGNVLYKSFIFFTKAKAAAVILGASAPIVLTSRSDSEQTKQDSITLAAVVD